MVDGEIGWNLKRIIAMKKFGLIGYPLSHSFSQKYFTEKFKKEGVSDCVYTNYPLESIEQLPELLDSNPELIGLNVTIPYKEKVLVFLSDIDADAQEIGAVNTIKIDWVDGQRHLTGYNTDVYGFRLPLEEVLSSVHERALILGTGGAAKAVNWVLKSKGIQTRFVSRRPKSEDDFSYEMLNEAIISDYKIIVNTSPIGMHPNMDACPDIPYEGISKQHILYDLIYNPEQTLFLKNGAKKEATLLNGLPMLYLQAEKAWQVWNRSND